MYFTGFTTYLYLCLSTKLTINEKKQIIIWSKLRRSKKENDEEKRKENWARVEVNVVFFVAHYIITDTSVCTASAANAIHRYCRRCDRFVHHYLPSTGTQILFTLLRSMCSPLPLKTTSISPDNSVSQLRPPYAGTCTCTCAVLQWDGGGNSAPQLIFFYFSERHGCVCVLLCWTELCSR